MVSTPPLSPSLTSNPTTPYEFYRLHLTCVPQPLSLSPLRLPRRPSGLYRKTCVTHPLYHVFHVNREWSLPNDRGTPFQPVLIAPPLLKGASTLDTIPRPQEHFDPRHTDPRFHIGWNPTSNRTPVSITPWGWSPPTSNKPLQTSQISPSSLAKSR